jgi:hypothetical protein
MNLIPFIAMILFSFFIGIMAGTRLPISYLMQKHKCEQALPRNVQCVWAPPTGGENG